MNWLKRLKGKVRYNEPLSKHTTFKIGGRARFFIEPKDIQDLWELLRRARERRIRVLVIGAGSNLLVSDSGIDAAVVELKAPYFRGINRYGSSLLEVGAGVSLSGLLRYTTVHSLSGCEFLAGIPGTVGAALIINAGVPKKNIGDLVTDVTVMDYRGNIKVFKKKDISFSYRKSNLSKYIMLSTHIKLKKSDTQKVRQDIKEYLRYRKHTQDVSYPSAGCVFKNPQGDSAGRLIDLCGLKGMHIGDAYVCGKHANFILNKGKACAADVLKLMRHIQKVVQDKFGVMLEPEIKIWH